MVRCGSGFGLLGVPPPPLWCCGSGFGSALSPSAPLWCGVVAVWSPGFGKIGNACAGGMGIPWGWEGVGEPRTGIVYGWTFVVRLQQTDFRARGITPTIQDLFWRRGGPAELRSYMTSPGPSLSTDSLRRVLGPGA